MSVFRVKISTCIQAGSELTSVYSRLETASQDLSSISRGIQSSIGNRAGIKGRLNQIVNSLSGYGRKTSELSRALSSIVKEYGSAEQRASGGKLSQLVLREGSGGNSTVSDGGAMGGRGSEESDSNWLKGLKDIIDNITKGHTLISDARGTSGDGTGWQSLGLISGIADYVDKLDKLIHSDPGKEVQNGLGWGKSLSDIASKLYKFVDEKDKADKTGLLSSFVGVLIEETKASERSVTEQLKNSGGIISAGTSLSKAIWKVSDDGRYESWLLKHASKQEQLAEKWKSKGDLAAISSLFTMGTYAAGDIMERSKDGVYDLQDYSGTLLNTGITGMGSLASGLTGGLVKVDTKRSGYIFDYTIEKTQNWIKDTAGDSTLGRALLLPAGAVYATATGIYGTFVDCGVQIGESIKKFWQGKNYTPNDSMEYLRYINQREGAYGFGYSESGGGGFR